MHRVCVYADDRKLLWWWIRGNGFGTLRGMKVCSWNVNGLRAAGRKGFLDWFAEEQADVVCLQEIKAVPAQLTGDLLAPLGYHGFFECAQKPGYSGVAIYTRTRPRSVHYGCGVPEVDREGRVLRVDFENRFRFQSNTLLERFKARLPTADLVVVSDYGKGTVHNVQDYIVSARAVDCPVLVDPKGQDFSIYRNATVITPNLQELEAVVGPCTDEQTLVNKGMALLKELCLDALLITRGEQGMNLLRRTAAPLHLSARAREVYDVTGAGDTVIATLAASLATGLDLATGILLANAAAGIVVGKLGAAGVTGSELQRALYEHAEPAKGSVSEEQLITAVADAKRHGETIVMTNGCFDILHAGHVGYLEQARRLGNRLIVAVNDDASVRRLKGVERPVNKLEQRMQVLAGLAAVDWVVSFSEDTPERLICRVKPDYLVKGGDHAPDTIAGGRCVREAGGQVVAMDYFDGHSTSGIIARILDHP